MSLNSMDSRLRQDSSHSEDFFKIKEDLVNPDIHESKTMKINSRNLLDDFPKVESFILPKEEDNLYSNKTSVNHTIDLQTPTGSKSHKRLRRWLKCEDRKMIQVISDLTFMRGVSDNLVKDCIEVSEETRNIWNVIRSMLKTSRSIDWLQSRYFKLLGNQSLNTKEMSLLSDKYDTIPVEKFMIVFPGKSKETLTTLIESFKARATLKAQDFKKLNTNSKTKNSSKVCSIGTLDLIFHFFNFFPIEIEPTVTLSSSNDKIISIEIDQLVNFSESDMLKKFDRRTLQNLNYSIKQIIGKINSEITKVRSEILLSNI
jgi:hypothetical protein